MQTLQPGSQSSKLRYSIVITCYNQRNFVASAIESVLCQGQTSRELIVVDDGSTDGSLEVVKRYEGSIRLLALAENCGAIEARNRGAALATGEYLIFLDGDDLFTTWALDVYDQLIVERQPVTIVSGARWFSGPVPAFEPYDAPEKIEFVEYGSLMARDRQHGWLTGAFVVARQAFHQAGGWTAGIFQLDLMDLAAKLGYSGKSILVCSPHTMLYRMHDANSVRCVPPFLASAQLMIALERADHYPGGRAKRFERYAFLGGMVWHWGGKALAEGFYGPAFRLASQGWPMVLAALLRKAALRVKGQRRVEVRKLGDCNRPENLVPVCEGSHA
jgi:glycosyltransferase involved in cell wall biosynthesis